MAKVKIVHYINQFFGQIGGEEKADIGPQIREGAVGPGVALSKVMGEEGEILATVICGDSYFNENIDKATIEVMDMIKNYQPSVVIVGPAFNAGRYGVACGAVAKAVSEQLEIPVVSGMYPENPGVDLYKKYAYIVETSNSAVGMRKAVVPIAKLALKLGNKNKICSPKEEGYIPRGIRVNYFAEERGAKRAVDMLVKKVKGEEFETEYPMPVFDRVTPSAPITDLSKAKIALVTSGGIVPKGNPDKIEASSASKYGKYSLKGLRDLSSETHETAHGGYDPVAANEDADRVLPLDVLREFEEQGVIGKLHDYYYATVGNGTSVANSKKYAKEIAKDLLADGVQGVILTST